MTTETTPSDSAVDDTVAKAEEENLRKFARIQLQESEKHNLDRLEQSLSRASDADFRRVVIMRYGYDPGI
jgi:hypothetical protein